jgi:hypothetical protein
MLEETKESYRVVFYIESPLGKIAHGTSGRRSS